jgi:hypothetical protein
MALKIHHDMRRAVLALLRERGALTLRELQHCLGARSRGNCHLFVLDYFVRLTGLSDALRGALFRLLWAGEIEIVPARRSVLLRVTP